MQHHVREILKEQNPTWGTHNPAWDDPNAVFQPSDHDEAYEGISLFRDEEDEPYRTIGGVVGVIMWGIVIVLLVGFALFLMSAPFLVIWQYILA